MVTGCYIPVMEMPIPLQINLSQTHIYVDQIAHNITLNINLNSRRKMSMNNYQQLADLLFPHVNRTPAELEQQYPPRTLSPEQKITRFAGWSGAV